MLDYIVQKKIPGAAYEVGERIPGSVVATWRTAERLVSQRYLRPSVDVPQEIREAPKKQRASKPEKD